MVNGFDPCDDLYQLWSAGMDVLHELGLGIRGPGNEDCTRVSYRGGHVLKKFLIFRRVSTADRARLVMDVSRRLMRMQDQAINGSPGTGASSAARSKSSGNASIGISGACRCCLP
jgi:hypothetical protein